MYLGTSRGLWPKPNLDFEKEIRFYKAQFEKQKEELSDVEFVVDQLITSKEDLQPVVHRLEKADGILLIHFNIGIRPILTEILQIGKPTVIFADPYSGHEWVGFGELQKQKIGAKLECILSSDYTQLIRIIRPYGAPRHLAYGEVADCVVV